MLSCRERKREVHGGVVSPVAASSEDREGSKGGLVTFICGLRGFSSQVYFMKTIIRSITCLTVPLDITDKEHIKL